MSSACLAAAMFAVSALRALASMALETLALRRGGPFALLVALAGRGAGILAWQRWVASLALRRDVSLAARRRALRNFVGTELCW